MKNKLYSVFFALLIINLVSCIKIEKQIEQQKNPVLIETTDNFKILSNSVEIAKWQGDKQTALLLYFDDSTPGQAQLAVPLLNELNMVGTFFVNPGGNAYMQNKEIWEVQSQKAGGGCQELANHSMHHHGAQNYAEAESEIYEPSKIIWQARGDSESSPSLMAFNPGGGTDWGVSDEQLSQILAKHKNVNRLHNPIVRPMHGTQILPGASVEDILRNRQKSIDDKWILMLSFHGIAKEDATPPNKPMDWGNGAVYIGNFRSAMQSLKQDIENGIFWSAGYIQLYKYMAQLPSAKVKLEQKNNVEFSLELSTDKDANLFDEPMTLIVNLPIKAKEYVIEQNSKQIAYKIRADGRLQFDAVPNKNSLISINAKADFYVSPTGNNSNTGTNIETPLKSIKQAVANLVNKFGNNGGLILVEDGVYSEFIDIKNSGVQNMPLQIVAKNPHRAEVYGFRILQDNGVSNAHIKIADFKIESNLDNSPHSKCLVNYAGQNVEFSGNLLKDCPTGGIQLLKNAKANIIKNNQIEHSGCFGIMADAQNTHIENNTIKNIVNKHPKLSEDKIPLGCDADGIVIYGKNHTIVRNKILDLAEPFEQNFTDARMPHSDGIQSSSSAQNTVLQNSKIYQNYIRINYKSGKGIILEANKADKCKDIIIANNIIEFTDIGIDASTTGAGGYENIQIYNNVFKSNLEQTPWGNAIWLRDVNNYEFINNASIDCKNEHRKIQGGTGVVDYNYNFNTDNSSYSLTPVKQAHEITGDADFVKYTGMHGQNDYKLNATSILLNAGKKLDSADEAIVNDFENKPRDGEKWNIGAY